MPEFLLVSFLVLRFLKLTCKIFYNSYANAKTHNRQGFQLHGEQQVFENGQLVCSNGQCLNYCSGKEAALGSIVVSLPCTAYLWESLITL